MITLTKHLEFFKPTDVSGNIHVIGVGAIGSRIAEQLVRLGIPKIHIWDFDTVDPHNIPNQIYRGVDIGKEKTEAMLDILKEINPAVEVKIHGAYEKQNLSGYVFLCVDSIELRKDICEFLKNNRYVKAIFDARMRLTDAQSYGADWTKEESRDALLNTMQFTSEEAKEATPVSACGTTLSVVPTVLMVASVTVSNFINLITKEEVASIILLDAFSFNLNAF